jgi:lipid-A-disaccharide synthase-like uncharacterized protein
MSPETPAVLLRVVVLLLLMMTLAGQARAASEDGVRLDITLPGVAEVELLATDPEGLVYAVRLHGGGERRLSPAQFTDFVDRAYRDRSRLEILLNISGGAGVLWVLLGFAAQAMFSGRMLVQWLVSERRRRSVVPPVFWWMSLAGGLMLLAYFIWRRDIVGVTGQATGVLVYGRNLWLLRRAG